MDAQDRSGGALLEPAAGSLPPPAAGTLLDAASDALLEPATLARLKRFERGEASPRFLRLGDVAPGDVGVVEAIVLALGESRTYKRGSVEGRLSRVTLRDPSGEADLVLWDSELDLVRDGVLSPGRVVRLRGVQAKAGWKSGVELVLGGALVEAVDRRAGFDAILESVESAPDAVEAVLRAGGDRRRLRVAGPLGRLLDHPAGTRLTLEGILPHPLIEGWWVAGVGFHAGVAAPARGRN